MLAALRLPRASVTLAEQPRRASVKHLNRLEQVLARRECAERHWPDALMCDAQGRLIATTLRNLVFADGADRWWTPDLRRAGVAGVTRQRLMAARDAQGAPPAVVDIDPARLADFQAAIACNSVGGAIAVDAIDGHTLPASRQMAAAADRLL